MGKERDFSKIQIRFKDRLTTLDLSDTFSILDKNLIGITHKNYRRLYVDRLTEGEFDELVSWIKLAISKSEPLAIEFYANNKDEIEPLYSDELDHYEVKFDLISYGLSKNDNQLPNFEFDILIDCMDKNDQPIFMYDSRGCCAISFELNHLHELRVTEVS